MSDLVKYDPETGILTWAKPRPGVRLGGAIGSPASHGYLQMSLRGKKYLVHRFIWDLVNPNDKLGPGQEIDHINHVKTDNRLCNLRKVSRGDNCKNIRMHTRNTSGHTGIHFDKVNCKWAASIAVSGEYVFLGRFAKIEDAVAVRKEAENHYGFHANHGERR